MCHASCHCPLFISGRRLGVAGIAAAAIESRCARSIRHQDEWEGLHDQKICALVGLATLLLTLWILVSNLRFTFGIHSGVKLTGGWRPEVARACDVEVGVGKGLRVKGMARPRGP